MASMISAVIVASFVWWIVGFIMGASLERRRHANADRALRLHRPIAKFTGFDNSKAGSARQRADVTSAMIQKIEAGRIQ